MPVPSQGHYGFHSFPVVDWFCNSFFNCLGSILKRNIAITNYMKLTFNSNSKMSHAKAMTWQTLWLSWLESGIGARQSCCKPNWLLHWHNVTITITKAAALNYTAHMHTIVYVVMGNTRWSNVQGKPTIPTDFLAVLYLGCQCNNQLGLQQDCRAPIRTCWSRI
jgi:hypothetical protein